MRQISPVVVHFYVPVPAHSFPNITKRKAFLTAVEIAVQKFLPGDILPAEIKRHVVPLTISFTQFGTLPKLNIRTSIPHDIWAIHSVDRSELKIVEERLEVDLRQRLKLSLITFDDMHSDWIDRTVVSVVALESNVKKAAAFEEAARVSLW
jgi:hypothetical protein